MLTELDLLLRALASPTRLRILAILMHTPRDNPRAILRQPWALAHALHIARPTLTFHLKVLLRMRLVNYRKLGRDKFYRLASVRAGSIRSCLLDRICPEIPVALGPVPPHVSLKRGRTLTRPRRHSDANQKPLGSLWRALTSFSHFRRLLMLRLFDRRGRADMGDLMQATGLSETWVVYHLDKLLRRGVVAESPSGGYMLCPKPPSSMQDFLTGLLRRQLAGDPQRHTSHRP